MKALIFGKNGALACSLAKAFLDVGWSARQIGRTEFVPEEPHDVYVFPQGQFLTKPFTDTDSLERGEIVNSVLMVPMGRLRLCLEVPGDERRDYVLIGSTSSYQGFANTAVYCAAKHALVGLVRALNDEYKETNRRFWLFSMGTMDTPMGRQLTDQDPSTFLSPDDVARRIVETVTDRSNLFEPEVIIRRRNVG